LSDRLERNSVLGTRNALGALVGCAYAAAIVALAQWLPEMVRYFTYGAAVLTGLALMFQAAGSVKTESGASGFWAGKQMIRWAQVAFGFGAAMAAVSAGGLVLALAAASG
jgi:hypothetical protein